MKIVVSLCLLFFSSVTLGQTLTAKELRSLYGKVFDITMKDRDSNPNRTSEILMCFLDIDSGGKVSGFHILSDEKNRGEVYKIFSQANLEAFKKWTCDKCGEKTLMIPIIFSANKKGNPKYVDDVAEIYLKGIDPNYSNFKIVSETKSLIMVNPFQYEIIEKQ